MRKSIVLNTTYILPFFGIEVSGVDDEKLLRHREDDAGLLYPQLLLPELAAKIAKEMRRHGLREPPQQVSEALMALLLEVYVGLVQPRAEHLENAMTPRALGHPDVFDCILYVTALHEETLLPTKDEKLLRFLEENRFNTNMFIELWPSGIQEELEY